VVALAKKLREQYPDANDFIQALDRAVGVDSTYLTTHAPVLYSTDELAIIIHFPYPLYRFGLIEAIRKRDSIATVVMPTSVAISVSPSRIDAPDITKVIVERDGRAVAPLQSTLKPTAMSTRIGAKATLHAGILSYPCSAFDPDATMHVVAVPESGQNIEKDISFIDLMMFSPRRSELSFTLVGQAASDVEKRIGSANRIDGKRWAYDINGGVVSLYFDDSEHVTSVQPRTFDLRDLTKTMGQRQQRPPVAASPQTAPQPTPPAAASPQKAVSPTSTDEIPAPKRPATELVGKRQADVNRLLGKPSLNSNGTWYFDTAGGTLRVVFSEFDEIHSESPVLRSMRSR
jgi:hypothetical protein